MKEAVGGLAYALYSSNGSRPAGYVNTSADVGLNGTAALPLNTWTHLAMTYDGTTLRMFVNGVQVNSLPVTGGITATSGALRIGGNSVWSEHLPRAHRRRANLQPRPQRHGDSNGHEYGDSVARKKSRIRLRRAAAGV